MNAKKTPLGSLLQREITRQGIRQRKLAAMARLPNSYLNAVINARKEPPGAPVLDRLGMALGLDQAGKEELFAAARCSRRRLAMSSQPSVQHYVTAHEFVEGLHSLNQAQVEAIRAILRIQGSAREATVYPQTCAMK
jgi:hypothetical protein